MAISFRKYIDIVSGVGGGAAVALRDLIGRLFTTNILLPTGSFIEFESADEVGDYFGTSSEEYLRAVFYFGWISKNISRPRKISYARWTPSAVAPRIFGAATGNVLADFTSIDDGAFDITLGGTTHTIEGLDFTGAGSLTAVAALVQAGINAEAGTMWTAATVTYNAVAGRFELVGGSTGAAAVAVDNPGTSVGTDIADLLGWLTGAILSDGAAAEQPVDAVTASAAASNNFGSFLFQDTITLDQIIAVAEWNDTQNVSFQYTVPVSAANASTWSAALVGISGVELTLAGPAGEYHEMVPMTILAATQYSKPNAVQNYMFQQFDLTPTVTSTTLSNTYDGLRVNYYGATQTAGQQVSFYQRGLMMGAATDPVDMNVYANEQWLKDAAGVAIMNLLLGLSRVSANDQGVSQVLAVLQSVIDLALNNGTISVNKPLTTLQKLYITQQSDDPDAWRQVQNEGYWINCLVEPYTVDGRTEWKAVYLLIYSRDDTIRKVEGTHTLI